MLFLNRVIILPGILIFLLGCSDSVITNNNAPNHNQPQFSNDWIIPQNEILDGGPGLDGIPSIDNPAFADINSEHLQFLSDDRLVTGIKIGNEIHAYPHQILDWHEVVNDQINDVHFSITFCPLTGTAIAWETNPNMEFGVSGLIFRNNLILYDRNSYSRYSQMQVRGVNGPMSGTVLKIIPVVQTTWDIWKEMYPDSKILLPVPGFRFNYSGFMYGEEYLSGNSATLFPIRHQDNRLNNKELVFGIIEGVADENANVTVFPIHEFDEKINIIYHSIYNIETVIAGSSKKKFVVAFQRNLSDGTLLEFKPVENSLPVIMKDQEGNYLDIFGYAIEGPRKGKRLPAIQAYTGYWFAWVDLFPTLSLWQG